MKKILLSIRWFLFMLAVLAAGVLVYGVVYIAKIRSVDIGQDFNQPGQTTAAIPADKLGNPTYCGHCHTQIFQEWSASMHRFSSHNNPVYRRVTDNIRENGNPEHLKFCARCHEPMMLAAGEDLQGSMDSWSANSGLTCLSCHRITEVHGGNGQYVLTEPILHPFAVNNSPFLQEVHATLVKAFPWLHRKVLTQDFYKTAEYCQSCHSVTVPKSVNGVTDLVLQDEYEQWRHSAFASGKDNHPQKNCQDCHMPLVKSTDPAAKDGLTRSHRFSGGNTAIPRFNRDEDQVEASTQFLQHDRIGLEVTLVEQAAEQLNLQLSITSKNIGHAFPAGTADSNEAWLEILVRDHTGQTIAHLGGLEANQHLSQDAITFGIDYADANGVKTQRQNTTTGAVSVIRNTRIGPGEHRNLQIPLKLTATPTYPLLIEAKLNWRKYSPELMDWIFQERAIPAIPVTVMARDEFIFYGNEVKGTP